MDFEYFAEEINFKTLNYADNMYYPLNASPNTSETASAMELEYIRPDFSPESLPYAPIEKTKPFALQDYSKDSLKFARRVSKSFLQFLGKEKDAVITAFLDAASKILASQVSLLEVTINDNKKLMKDSLQLMRDVWNVFARNLSCTHNKKISKVTKDIWDIVFTEEGFWKAAKQVGTALQFKDYFSEFGEVEAEMIKGYFKKVIFLINKGLILFHLQVKKAGREDFYENIPKFENYIVLSMVPALFDAYNHKRGVFVDECCRACKVCQSKMADKTLSSRIKAAWEFAIAFEQNIKNNNAVHSFQDALNILQFIALSDDALVSFSR